MQITFSPVINRNFAFKGEVNTYTKIKLEEETFDEKKTSDKEDVKIMNGLLQEIKELKKTDNPDNIDLLHQDRPYVWEWRLKLNGKKVGVTRFDPSYPSDMFIETKTEEPIKEGNRSGWKTVNSTTNIRHNTEEKKKVAGKLVKALNELVGRKNELIAVRRNNKKNS